MNYPRESGIGNRESGIGNRESGIGNREKIWFTLLLSEPIITLNQNLPISPSPHFPILPSLYLLPSNPRIVLANST
ncbi:MULTISPECIES: hypothetical protein [Moorena]|uniref:hypothetical protein n=1 Tax=Moorena TaxID=1155738 RepID=UPI0002DEA671|nr:MULTISPECIES: hypothetical protein [Moorena]NEQ06560.1 hypothetical protein [Moorena sp. SIO4E2]NEQ15474.1 hypothetical protein [Moorena sp. SIO3E2]NES46652.1 hypothetical protein [Moorena sp. SIO2C4]